MANATSLQLDANDFATGLIYATNGANSSLHHVGKCFYETFAFAPTYKVQIAHGYDTNAGQIWQRSYIDNEWSPWYVHDNFGCSTAADLASLLGGVTIGINVNQDFNDFTTPGVLYVAASGSISTSLSHRPSGLIEAFMMMYFRNSPGQTQIIVTTWSAFKLYKRSYDNGWQKWQLVTGTAVEYAE